ncbi:MAG TPA: hypothetical protein VIO38_09315 [Rariglobus sp.]
MNENQTAPRLHKGLAAWGVIIPSVLVCQGLLILPHAPGMIPWEELTPIRIGDLTDPITHAMNPRQLAAHYGYSLILVLGALGGYVRWMHQMLKQMKSADGRWLLEALVTPLKGAILALLGTLVLRATTTTGAALDPAATNWAGLYAFAGLAGLFAKEAVARMEAMFRGLFPSAGEAPSDTPST